MQKVDETINALCDWIQHSLKDVNAVQEGGILPDMVKALAELVSARSSAEPWSLVDRGTIVDVYKEGGNRYDKV